MKEITRAALVETLEYIARESRFVFDREIKKEQKDQADDYGEVGHTKAWENEQKEDLDAPNNCMCGICNYCLNCLGLYIDFANRLLILQENRQKF